MTDLRVAAQQALEILERLHGGCTDSDDGTVEAITVYCPEIIDDLRAALAEPVQEPFCYVYEYDGPYGLHREFYPREYNGMKPSRTVPLYTAPPPRKPLSEEELDALAIDEDGLPNSHIEFARAVERAHGIV